MSAGTYARRWSDALLVLQFTLTLVLCAGAGLMMRSFLAVYRADQVLDTSRLLTLGLTLPDEKYSTSEHRTRFYSALEDRLNTMGGITAATTATSPPLVNAMLRPFSIDSALPSSGGAPPRISLVMIGSRYFETLGLRLVHGRGFGEADGTPGNQNAIVNQRFAELYLGGGDPIGRRVRVGASFFAAPPPNAPWFTIVGVSPTVRQLNSAAIAVSNNQDSDPVVYLPSRQEPDRSAILLVRSDGQPGAIASRVREAIQSLDRDLPVFDIRTMDQLAHGSRWAHQVLGVTFGLFACIAFVLSIVGLYAMTTYTVTQRTQELGIRLALGAQARELLWFVLRRGVAQLGIGIVIGLAGAVGVGRLLRSLMIHTSPTDPVTLLSITAMLATVAVVACIVPARRAARLDPAVTLRYE